MKTERRFSNPWFLGRPITIALLVGLAAGCASINHLREAQDAFNQAAATENALRFDTKASDAAAGLIAVRSGYASALLSLEKLEDSKEQAQLRNDGLWGTALTLKALTQWRLGQFDKAIATADQAKQNAGDQVYPRDQAVMMALPGLVKTDQAYDKIVRSNTTLVEVEGLLIGERGAVTDIQRARTQTDKDHPVQVYLLQAQLAAYRNYQVALDRLKNHATVSATDPARVQANAQLKELRRLLKAQQPGKPGEDLVNYWVQLCALDVP
jgi:tetratricopeptide (TPR) repeat protein